MATYGLEITPSEAPELPEGVDRDPVRRQDDFGESADVFGYVTLQLSLHPNDAGSAHHVSSWFVDQLKCDELAVGEIRFEGESTFVSLHSSKLSTAMKVIDKRPFNGHSMSASIVG